MNQITIKNEYIELTVLDFGAIIQKLIVKDKNGHPTNTVVGLESTEEYLKDNMYLGACIGRYAGRISNGSFTLEGKKYRGYQKNNVHLHGGQSGFNQKYFTIEEVNHGKEPYIKLSYLSPDLEEGYPGNLNVMVTYTLLANTLKITHEATTDKTTVVNLTNHSYFNLQGVDNGLIDNHILQIKASKYTPVNKEIIPTGEITSVKNTPFDFILPTKIGDRVN